MSNIDKIIKELKTRKVFRSLAIYAAFAFVLIQVCSIVVPALLLPEWTMRLLVVLVMIGFPTTLVLSWIYDITPTKNGDAPSTDTKQQFGVYTLTGLVLTVIGIGFWVVVGVFGVSFGDNEEVPSIGILMMENLGGENEEFWSSGMTADLITKVAGAGLIRVSPLDDIVNLEKKLSVEEKAKKLRVKYILTNRFQKKEDSFALWYQLINTEDGITVLTNKVTEPINMSTQMVGILANEIITALGVSTKQDILKAPTSNADAYEYYLKGKHKFNNRETLADTKIARELLQKAIEIDDEIISAKLLLAETYRIYSDKDRAMEIYEKALNQSEKLGDKKNSAIALRKIGTIYSYPFNNYDKALDYYTRSLEISELIDDKSLISWALNNIGSIYRDQNNEIKAFDYYTRAIKIAEEIGDKGTIAYISGFIGNYYESIGNFDTALDYYTSALEISEELDNKREMGQSLKNIGNLFYDKGDNDQAKDYYTRSLKIYEELGEKSGIATNLMNLGRHSSSRGDYDQANDYYTRSLKIYEELGKKSGISDNLLNIGWMYYLMGEYNQALDYYNRELEIIQELEYDWYISNNFANIGLVYFQKEDYKKAVEYLDNSYTLQMEIDSTIALETVSHLLLSNKYLGNKYDEKDIHKLLKQKNEIDDYINYTLFKLLEDTSYLETAYNQVMEKADNLEPDVAAKYLSCPIPKAIVEEWEKVN